MRDSPLLTAVTSEQRDAVRHLLAAAKHLKDTEDEIGFAEVWARDAHLTIRSNGRQIGPLIGRREIMDFYRGNWSRGSHGSGDARETHVAENPYVVALGDGRLRATHNVIFAAMSGEMPILIGFGEFTDEIVEEEGRWRIAVRQSSLRRRPKSTA